jgi:hypothetical protein
VKRLRIEFAGKPFDRAALDHGARVRREYLPGREILEKSLLHRTLLHRSAGVFSPNIDAMQVGQRVMRGQKRVEDARKRTYDPRIHLSRRPTE